MSPTCLVGGELQHVLGPRAPGEQSQTVSEGILFGSRRQLVDEAFDDESTAGGTHAAPECGRYTGWLLRDPIDVHVAQRISRIGRTFDGVEIDPILDRRRREACPNGRAG